MFFLFSSPPDPALITSPQTEELFDLIASSQSRRLDDQRVSVSNLPGLRITHNNLGHLCGEADTQEPSDDFFNMLIKCQVKSKTYCTVLLYWTILNVPRIKINGK